MKNYEQNIINVVFQDFVIEHLSKDDDNSNIAVQSIHEENNTMGVWKLEYLKPSIISDKIHNFSANFEFYSKKNLIADVYYLFNYSQKIFTYFPEKDSFKNLFDTCSEFYSIVNRTIKHKENASFSVKYCLDDYNNFKMVLIEFPIIKLAEGKDNIIIAKKRIQIEGDDFHTYEDNNLKKYNMKYLIKYLHQVTYEQTIKDLNTLLMIDISPKFNSVDDFSQLINSYKVVLDMIQT